MNPLLNVIKVFRHLPPQRLREEEGEGAGGDGHHGEDEGGDGGVDVGQRGHCGRQSPAHLGDQRGRAHARRPHCRGHQLAWKYFILIRDGAVEATLLYLWIHFL